MTTNFYAPPSAIRAGRVVLPDREARHARSVLRVGEGDELHVVDGEGGWYRVQVGQIGRQQVVGSIVEERSDVREPPVAVTVGIGVLKKRSRFETFVEKAVELGAHSIAPLRTRRTERDDVREERLRNLMIAAMKQCRRSWLPRLASPQSIETLLSDAQDDVRIICHGGDSSVSARQAVKRDGPIESALVLVGPEGGFAPSEVERAEAAGCTTVSLGARRLRTETAGLAALHSVVEGARETDV